MADNWLTGQQAMWRSGSLIEYSRRLNFATFCMKAAKLWEFNSGIMDNGRTPQIISLLSLVLGLISGNAAAAHANIKTGIWGGAALPASMGRAEKQTNKSEKGTSWMGSQKWGGVEWALKEGDELNGFSKRGTSWMGSQKGGGVEWVLKKGDKLNGFDAKSKKTYK